MQTIVTYKVVYVDNDGIVQEYDTTSLSHATQIKTDHPGSILYKISILGSIEKIT